jgi:hypothetical protein
MSCTSQCVITKFPALHPSPMQARVSPADQRLPGFTFVAHVSNNDSPQHFWLGGDYLKLRGWLLLFLFAHVMLHPWVHAIGVNKVVADHSSVSVPTGADNAAGLGDQCELCRVGHSAAITPKLPKVELLNPGRIHTALQAVNYASLQADQRRPSRAPPTL